MIQLSLEDYINSYPYKASAKQESTSREAARAIEQSGNAGHIQAMDNHLQDMRKLVFKTE